MIAANPTAESVAALEADNRRLRARLHRLALLVGLSLDDGGTLEHEVEYLVERTRRHVDAYSAAFVLGVDRLTRKG